MPEMQEFLKRYKNKQAIGHLATSNVPWYPLYWLVIYLLHIGDYEKLEITSRQLGLSESTVESLIDIAQSEVTNFPLARALEQKTNKPIIRINPNSIQDLQTAAHEVSPEHMPPPSIQRRTSGARREIATSKLFGSFRNSSSEYESETISILIATKGLEDYVDLTTEGYSGKYLIRMPSGRLIVMPWVGSESTGYYADRAQVLDIRGVAQELSSAESDVQDVVPVVISLGFTEQAKRAALQEPKVILFPLWTFLKSIDYVQKEDRENIGAFLFLYLNTLINEKGYQPLVEAELVGQVMDGLTTYISTLETGIASAPSIPKAFTRNQPPKVELIRETGDGTFMERYFLGAQSMAEELGIDLAEDNADAQPEKMISMVEAAVKRKADAIIIDHGRTEQLQPGIEKAIKMGIGVVTFDLVVDSPVVPEIEQDDLLIGLLISDHLVDDMGGQANVVYLNILDHAPLAKRDRSWQDCKWRYKNVREIAQLGRYSNSIAPDTQKLLEQELPNLTGANAVLAMWDEFAKGAVRAIITQGAASEIKVYSVDIADEDIQMMIQEDSPWRATAATDSFSAGRLAVRAAAALIGGENLNKYYRMKPILITQDFLRENSILNMEQLAKVVPELGESSLCWFPWMFSLLKQRGYKVPSVQ